MTKRILKKTELSAFSRECISARQQLTYSAYQYGMYRVYQKDIWQICCSDPSPKWTNSIFSSM